MFPCHNCVAGAWPISFPESALKGSRPLGTRLALGLALAMGAGKNRAREEAREAARNRDSA